MEYRTIEHVRKGVTKYFVQRRNWFWKTIRYGDGSIWYAPMLFDSHDSANAFIVSEQVRDAIFAFCQAHPEQGVEPK